jgi:hypothetical protein
MSHLSEGVYISFGTWIWVNLVLQINYQKDALIGAQFGLRLSFSDPSVGIYEWMVSTVIKNTVLFGYFAKIPPIIGILTCVFSSVIFVGHLIIGHMRSQSPRKCPLWASNSITSEKIGEN